MSRPRLPRASALLLGLAAALVLLKLGLELAGGRAAAGVLSGTDPGAASQGLLGASYAAAHLASVLLAPPLALAAAIRLAIALTGPPAEAARDALPR